MIYPIDQMIEELLLSCTDEETGEITASEEYLAERLESLQIGFDKRVRELRNEYINTMAEAEALKKEKSRIAQRQKVAENRADWLKRFLAYLTQGEAYRKDDVRITYRKSEETIIDDGFVDWAEIYAPGLLNYAEPTPRKADIKAALKEGSTFEYAHLEEKYNIQIK